MDFLSGIAQTLRAMPIAAAAVGDGDDMAASGTTIAVATECRRAAVCDGKEHFALQPGQPRPMSFDEAFARPPNDVSPSRDGSFTTFRFFLRPQPVGRPTEVTCEFY